MTFVNVHFYFYMVSQTLKVRSVVYKSYFRAVTKTSGCFSKLAVKQQGNNKNIVMKIELF